MPTIRALLALLLCASLGLGAELRTLDGKKVTGELTNATEKDVEIKTATGLVKTPVAQVLDVVLQPARPLGVDIKRLDVEMTDGSIFHCKPDGLAFKEKKVTLTLLGGQTVEADLKDVASYYKEAQDKKIQEMWKEILKQKVKLDRVVIIRKGKLNALHGVVGDADAKGEKIAFKDEDGENLNPVLENIRGLIFYRPNPNTVATLCQVHDAGGNLLVAQKLTLAKTGIKVTTVAGAVINYEKPELLTRLDYNINKLTFLSDLEPTEKIERSGSGLPPRYRRDRNLDDGAIQIDGTTYSKGLALHAHTELEYDLSSKYIEFRAILGVDETVGGDSKAQVTVLCDGVKVFSQEITRKKTLKNFVIKVKDVNKLRIIVSSNNVLDLHDHVSFANARVTQ